MNISTKVFYFVTSGTLETSLFVNPDEGKSSLFVLVWPHTQDIYRSRFSFAVFCCCCKWKSRRMKGISSSFPEIHQKEGGRLHNGWNATQLLLSEKVSGKKLVTSTTDQLAAAAADGDDDGDGAFHFPGRHKEDWLKDERRRKYFEQKPDRRTTHIPLFFS